MTIHSMRIATILVAAITHSVVLTACTQFPTEKSQVADLRPQISFKMNNPSQDLLAARVLVNGLDGGMVGSYLEGQGALRVLSGTNRVRVMLGSRIVLDEQVYLGDGVTRSLIIN